MDILMPSMNYARDIDFVTFFHLYKRVSMCGATVMNPVIPALGSAPSLKPQAPVMGKTSPFQLPPTTQRLENLQTRELFFSTTSPRAKIERFLNTPVLQQLCFPLVRLENAPWYKRLFQASNTALILQKRPPEQPAAAAGKDAKNAAPKAPTQLDVRLVHYQPLMNVPVLLKMLQNVTQKLPLHQTTPFLYNAAKDELVEAKTATAEPTPWAPVLRWLKGILPENRFLHVDEANGTLHLGTAKLWPLGQAWKTAEGQPLRRIEAIRLPNHQIGEVLKEETLETLTLAPQTNPLARKQVKDTLLKHLEAAEQMGYTLASETSTPAPVTVPAEQAPTLKAFSTPPGALLKVKKPIIGSVASVPFQGGKFKAANEAPPAETPKT